MRALVVGGDSKIGRVLCTRLLERDWVVVKTTRRDRPDAPVRENEFAVCQFDMRRSVLPTDDVDSFGAERGDLSPAVVFIMAAITGVVPAEEHPDAWRVNAEAPVALTLEAAALGWRVVFMSSGTVERAQHTASAMQKRYAEAIVHTCGGLVVRPLPVVPADRYAELCDEMIDYAYPFRPGILRWEG